MNLQQEIHEQILMRLFRPPGKLYTRGVEPTFGVLVRAPGERAEYRIVSQDELFENVPDFPSDRTGPVWFLVAIGDDTGTNLFVVPWEMVKDVLERSAVVGPSEGEGRVRAGRWHPQARQHLAGSRRDATGRPRRRSRSRARRR